MPYETHSLAKQAADLLGYRKLQTGMHEDSVRYEPVKRPKLRKYQQQPEINAWPNTVRIIQPNYDVTFYMHEDLKGLLFDGILITELPDNDVVNRILERWNLPWLNKRYAEKLKFLMINPEYQRPLPGPKTKEKVHASQIEI
jgi:hypothetical protein